MFRLSRVLLLAVLGVSKHESSVQRIFQSINSESVNVVRYCTSIVGWLGWLVLPLHVAPEFWDHPHEARSVICVQVSQTPQFNLYSYIVNFHNYITK